KPILLTASARNWYSGIITASGRSDASLRARGLKKDPLRPSAFDGSKFSNSLTHSAPAHAALFVSRQGNVQVLLREHNAKDSARAGSTFAPVSIKPSSPLLRRRELRKSNRSEDDCLVRTSCELLQISAAGLRTLSALWLE